jgi:Na+/H+ antiporter NhaB
MEELHGDISNLASLSFIISSVIACFLRVLLQLKIGNLLLHAFSLIIFFTALTGVSENRYIYDGASCIVAESVHLKVVPALS